MLLIKKLKMKVVILFVYKKREVRNLGIVKPLIIFRDLENLIIKEG